jgi:hypothetical protein
MSITSVASDNDCDVPEIVLPPPKVFVRGSGHARSERNVSFKIHDSVLLLKGHGKDSEYLPAIKAAVGKELSLRRQTSLTQQRLSKMFSVSHWPVAEIEIGNMIDSMGTNGNNDPKLE